MLRKNASNKRFKNMLQKNASKKCFKKRGSHDFLSTFYKVTTEHTEQKMNKQWTKNEQNNNKKLTKNEQNMN